MSTNDTVGKILAVWWPVFAFTAIGFEHSIANMFYVDIGTYARCTRTRNFKLLSCGFEKLQHEACMLTRT